MRAYERLLNYVKIWTTSEEESTSSPTTMRQLDLAKLLVEEMKAMGITDAHMDSYGYVYGHIPASAGMEQASAIGFIAHMDTAPDYSGEHVNPQIISNYDGADVSLGNSGKVLTVAEFPHLKGLKGKTLITTDGQTLLGADDKAGIAEILTVAEHLLQDGITHGPVSIAFTTDEEVGSGACYFDMETFAAPYAYTLDGEHAGEIQFENFNACTAIVTVHGVNVHPGSAKGIMRNAQTVAMEFHAMLPAEETPECTEGYEGFFHMIESEGNVEQATLRYIVRDFDADSYAAREALLRQITGQLNQKYGAGTVELEIKESYRNMREMIEPCMHLIDIAVKGCEEAGVTPDISPIRGGTDGARLSFCGLPCPNLGTGGYAFHGPYEHIAAEDMDAVVKTVERMIIQFSKITKN